MKNNTELYDLIEKFEFSDLSEDNVKMVLSEITKEEYHQMREQIIGLSSVFKEEVLAPIISEDLIDLTKSNKKSISLMHWKLKIPYAVAIAVLAFIGGNLSSNLGKKEMEFQPTFADNQTWEQDTVLTSLFITVP